MKNFIFKNIALVLSFLFVFSPIKSFADDENSEIDLSQEEIAETIETSGEITDLPTINCRHAVIFDRSSKHTLYGKKETEKCKMASTTKIMTAIIVLENSNLNDIVQVSKKSALTAGSRLGLSENDKITVENLLYGLMLKSGNDAAIALAEHVGGNVENFALMMNSKSKELGLLSTNFVTPHGLDNDNHYTTALDLALLTDYALQNTTFSKIVKTKTYTVFINNSPKIISNTNELLGNFDGIYGVKTGFTNGANRCLVTSCKRGDLDIICVVLGCDTKKDRTRDSIKLLNYTFKNYIIVNVRDILINDFNNWYSTHTESFFIDKGVSNNIELYLNDSDFQFSHIAIKKADINKISSNIAFSSCFNAPLICNTKIGELTLYIDNTKCFTINILNRNYIAKKNYCDYIKYFFKSYYKFFGNPN